MPKQSLQSVPYSGISDSLREQTTEEPTKPDPTAVTAAAQPALSCISNATISCVTKWRFVSHDLLLPRKITAQMQALRAPAVVPRHSKGQSSQYGFMEMGARGKKALLRARTEPQCSPGTSQRFEIPLSSWLSGEPESSISPARSINQSEFPTFQLSPMLHT